MIDGTSNRIPWINCLDRDNTAACVLLPPRPDLCIDCNFTCQNQWYRMETGSGNKTPVFDCPLCFKCFASDNTYQSHLKSCGVKNGLTCNRVVDALRLQQKYAEERRKLGLPARVLRSKRLKAGKRGGVKQPKRYNFTNLNFKKLLEDNEKILPGTSGTASDGLLLPAQTKEAYRKLLKTSYLLAVVGQL
ncbi:uncharacterized protein LOC106473250 [Limulus polyphemus]|uniref:Uncharacterized protein LOC106473250 n=1 Tax=Limulus polyphemus TaxID=6850 RepID=A0ABM1BVC1_LIMPO|nr:uncharacterized protein LOC106473250 [Limulus polyphemus]